MGRKRTEAIKCAVCGGKIPKARLEALPDTKTCVKCSHVKPKTIFDIEVDGPDSEDLIHASQNAERTK